jgi:hypothetical protein
MPRGVYKRTQYHIEACCKKGGAANKGVKHPNQSIKMKGKNNPFYGKKHPKETMDRIREKLKGKRGWSKGLTKETNESVRKIAEAKVGIPRPEHVKRILREAAIGHIPWNKGKKCPQLAGANNPMFGRCGKDSPNFKGGKSYEPYPPEFHIGLLREIRKRDSYTCLLCGKDEKEELKEFNRNLSVHHIDYDKDNCDKINLLSLCGRCNSIVNFDREDWTDYFNGVIKFKYS